MSAIPSAYAPIERRAAVLTAPLLLLLAVGTGLAVACLYYCQPMLGVIAADLGVDEANIGWVPTLTQLGYAIGLLLSAPLGDRFDRRVVILAKVAVLCGALLLASVAPSLAVLLVASLSIGIAATLAQDLVPAAATLADPARRGKVVGTVMMGLLLGILLSRVVSGLVAAHTGWRAMFTIAAGSIALLGVALWRGLPSFPPTTLLTYRQLLASIATLWRAHQQLRRSAISQGFLALGFGAFWSTLAMMLHAAPFHLGSSAAGAFGLAGAAGAIAAPIAGGVADKRGPIVVVRFAAGLAAISFAVMWLAPSLSTTGQLALIAVASVGFDLGIQASLVSHQTIIYSLDPAARSRLNAVLMVGVFVGMAAGAMIGSRALAAFGWPGVVTVATVASVLALVVRVWPSRG